MLRYPFIHVYTHKTYSQVSRPHFLNGGRKRYTPYPMAGAMRNATATDSRLRLLLLYLLFLLLAVQWRRTKFTSVHSASGSLVTTARKLAQVSVPALGKRRRARASMKVNNERSNLK